VAHSPLISFLLLGAGIVLLYYGGEHLVDGAASLARSFGLSSMVIGLTVVAFGTSAPELAASLTAALKGAPEIAVANVIGSNIANLALVLAVAAMIKPMLVETAFIRREVPFMILVSLLFGVLVHQDLMVRWAGAGMLVLLALYLWFLLRVSDSPEDAADEEDDDQETTRPLWSALRVALGVLLLAVGARVLVEGALGAAESLGISKRVIGLTLVALGTSLPELATVIVAAMKRQTDLILGNLIGSNIFNILCILGATLLVRPLSVDFQEVRLDLAVMTAIAIALLPMLYFYGRIGRKRGALLLTSYVIYIVALFV
jgi:cation:H+ antiporter